VAIQAVADRSPRAALHTNLGCAQKAVGANLQTTVVLQDMNGPLLPFTRPRSYCGAARHSGHALQLRNPRQLNSHNVDERDHAQFLTSGWFR
jgi:hypothetical protein